MNRRPVCKLGGKLNKSLCDQYGDRVEVARVGFKTEALCFERDRATTTERIDDASAGRRGTNAESRFVPLRALFSSFDASHGTSRSMILNSRCRSRSWSSSVGNSSG